MLLTNKRESIDFGLQGTNIDYKQSANTLFNFMTKLDYLVKDIENMKLYPRYVVENVEYLNLKIGNRSIEKVAFPMLCFCDINLHNLSLHVENDESNGTKGYGKYGIGLDKTWCERKGFQPIMYANRESEFLIEFSKLFNKNLDLLYSDLPLEEEFSNFILDQLRLTKPLKGIMNRNGEWFTKNFHDEKEWRYLPDMSEVEMAGFLNDATKPREIENVTLNEMSDTLTNENSVHLDLDLECINYIFVDNSKDRDTMIDVIKKSFGDDIDKSMNLASKIVIYEQIARDW